MGGSARSPDHVQARTAAPGGYGARAEARGRPGPRPVPQVVRVVAQVAEQAEPASRPGAPPEPAADLPPEAGELPPAYVGAVVPEGFALDHAAFAPVA